MGIYLPPSYIYLVLLSFCMIKYPHNAGREGVIMSELTPLAKRILQLKGAMSYDELSKDIEKKTGRAISSNGLQNLGSGKRRMGRESTLNILAEYAGKPKSWFYEEDTPAPMVDAVAEAKAKYMMDSGDPEVEAVRRQAIDQLARDGALTPENLRTLADLLEMMAKDPSRVKDRQKP